MANWSLPTITDLYANFLAYLKARDDDAVKMNDSRVTAATNVPDYTKRWNDATKTIQNWLSSQWTSLILGVAGGGTGSSTAAGARTNLSVYSIAEADAAFATALTTGESVLSGNVTLTTISTYYDGPTVVLAAGKWLIVGNLTIAFSSGAPSPSFWAKMWDGTTDCIVNNVQLAPNSNETRTSIPLMDIVILGTAATIRLAAMRTTTGNSYIMDTYSYIRAVKIA